MLKPDKSMLFLNWF